MREAALTGGLSAFGEYENQLAADADGEDKTEGAEVEAAQRGMLEDKRGVFAATGEARNGLEGIEVKILAAGEEAEGVFAPLFVISDGIGAEPGVSGQARAGEVIDAKLGYEVRREPGGVESELVEVLNGVFKLAEAGLDLLFDAKILDGGELSLGKWLRPVEAAEAFALEKTVDAVAVVAADLLAELAAFHDERESAAWTLESSRSRLKELGQEEGGEQEQSAIVDGGDGEGAGPQQEVSVEENPAEEVKADNGDPERDAGEGVVGGQADAC